MIVTKGPQSAVAGFSNQQALLLLLIAFPIGLIGYGLVMTVAVRLLTPQTEQAPAPIEEAKKGKELPTSVETPPPVELPESTSEPLANRTSGLNSDEDTCWFQMETDGRLVGDRCSVNQRINANGDKVFDVVEQSGMKQAAVLWDNKEAEVFLQGQRYTGNWSVNYDGDVRVSPHGGTFAFKPPA